jgi:hypothetical protein
LTTNQALKIFTTHAEEFSKSSVRVITDMFRIEESVDVKYAGEELIKQMILQVLLHCNFDIT